MLYNILNNYISNPLNAYYLSLHLDKEAIINGFETCINLEKSDLELSEENKKLIHSKDIKEEKIIEMFKLKKYSNDEINKYLSETDTWEIFNDYFNTIETYENNLKLKKQFDEIINKIFNCEDIKKISIKKLDTFYQHEYGDIYEFIEEKEKKIRIINNFFIFFKYYCQYYEKSSIYKTYIKRQDVEEARKNNYKLITDEQKQFLLFDEIVELFNCYSMNKSYQLVLLNYEINKIERDVINKILLDKNIENVINEYIYLNKKERKIELEKIEIKDEIINFKLYDKNDEYTEKELKKIYKSTNKYLRSYLFGIILSGNDSICSDSHDLSSLCILLFKLYYNLHLRNCVAHCNCGNGNCCHMCRFDVVLNCVLLDNVYNENDFFNEKLKLVKRKINNESDWYEKYNEREMKKHDKMIEFFEKCMFGSK